MKIFEITERKVINHTYEIKADCIADALHIANKHLSPMNKTPWEKVTTKVNHPEIEAIKEISEEESKSKDPYAEAMQGMEKEINGVKSLNFRSKDQ